jgi:hypothetical protein
MATAEQVREFRQANQALVALAQRELTDFWASLTLTRDPAVIRDELLSFFPDLLQSYGDTAAVLGADWYDLLRDVPSSARAFDAVIAGVTPVEQAEQTARWGIAPLFTENPDDALARLLGATHRLVLQPGRDSIWDSAQMDSFRTGVARVPSGTTTCKFCVMLASRGAVYQSQVSAELVVGRGSNRTGYDADGKRLRGGIGGGVKPRGRMDLGRKFHDRCDCVSVVVRSPSDYPAGYDPDALRDLYNEGVGIGVNH